MKRFILFRAELGLLRFELSFCYGLIVWFQMVPRSHWSLGVTLLKWSHRESGRMMTTDDLVERIQPPTEQDELQSRMQILGCRQNQESADLSLVTGNKASTQRALQDPEQIRNAALDQIQGRRKKAEDPESALAKELETFCHLSRKST